VSSPYDTLIRLQKRQVDEVKLAIGQAVEQVDQVERAQHELVSEVQNECLAAQGELHFSTYAYVQDRKRRAAQLVQMRQQREQMLDRLREEATEAFGQLRVVENAAEAFAARKAQERSRKEQAEADDLSSARMLLRLRKEKAAGRSVSYD